MLEAEVADRLVMCEFLDVFLKDVSDFSSEREMEFTIDLVPSTIPVSMVPYRVSTSDLSELKK